MSLTLRSAVAAALLAGLFVGGPALAEDKHRKTSAKKKVEAGASCKAPALGTCAACNITCRPGEAAHCAPGTLSGDVCHAQPSCKCIR